MADANSVRKTDEGVIELRFDGKRFGHWQQCRLRRTIEDLCEDLTAQLTLPGTGSSLGLTPNTKIEVLIDDELVATIRPDKRTRKVGATSHTIDVQARSLARELVDCKYSKTLSGLKLGEIVKRLGSTFNVPVKVQADTAVVKDFAMQCEQPANALLNAVKAANLLLYPTADGGLCLAEPTKAAPVCTLEYGVHIKEYTIIDEDNLRFSDYTIKSFDGAADKALKGAVQDDGIAYFRPMHVVADKQGTSQGALQRRAEQERTRRRAKAHRIEVEVQGWRYLDADGKRKLWDVNLPVRVIIEPEDVNTAFIVAERSFDIDSQGGRVTVLDLQLREALLGGDPDKDKKTKGRGSRRRRTRRTTGGTA